MCVCVCKELQKKIISRYIVKSYFYVGLQLILPCLKSMTWVMENMNSNPADKVAVINLKVCALSDDCTY